MMSSYFFIPANKSKLIEKGRQLMDIDNRIYDFEDSIIYTEIKNALFLLSQTIISENDWVRLPFDIELANVITQKMSIMGCKNYVIPKFKGINELDRFFKGILAFNLETKFIFLIENSKSLLDLELIIDKYGKQTYAVALGSHDFSAITGIENNINFLRQIRINILIICKAYGIEAIDVASMNISDIEEIKNEIIDGFRCGYRAKFILHPKQLEALKEVKYYTRDQINEYKDVLRYYYSEIQGKRALFKYKGKIYEKMHIEQMETIIKWGEDYYFGANR